ncbi:MAG: sugar ABC transporter ATP-binding protein [Chloroflexota bacterium]
MIEAGRLSGRTPASTGVPLLRVRGVSKRFLGTLALNNVDFEVSRGEVHALLGQNGAGKSTLIKILAGVHAPDHGDIELDGQPVDPSSNPLPIAFIHQDLGLVPSMTVAENVALGAGYSRPRFFISWRAQRERAAMALAAVGVDIDPEVDVASLSVAERALVAIGRALAVAAELLVLDEPTAALAEVDVSHLFVSLRRLRDQGVGILYVSHRIDEVFRIADRVTVLRDGRRVASAPVADTSPGQLVRWIVGRDLAETSISGPPAHGDVVLSLLDVCLGPVGPVSLKVAAGEILGLVGLRGAGQNAVGRGMFGTLAVTSGQMALGPRAYAPHSARDAIRAGVALVPGDRVEESLASSLSVEENLFMNPAVQGRRLIGKRAERSRTLQNLERFDIRPRDPERPVGSLSGGNQQKVVIARWLDTPARVVVLEEPTAGVDVGAKAQIYRLLDEGRASGRALVVVSSDFEEIARICDRALVFSRGRVIGEMARDELSVASLTALATGSV